MTDSTPQYQRATAGDVEWLERIVESGRTGEVRNFPLAVARRILNSLRATPAVPDREALARALFAGCLDEEPTADRLDRLWLEITCKDERNAWRRQADRLVRVLGGGFPAVLEREVTLEDTDGEMLEQSGVEDGDTIRPPATNNDVAWLTRAYRTEGQRESALRILTALVDTPSPAVLEQEPRAWEVQRDGKPYNLVRLSENADSYRELPAEYGFTVTPLYAAAPQVDTQTT